MTPPTLPADSHVHTEWSWDADEGSMRTTCEEAMRLGVPVVAFTEHLDHGVRLDPAGAAFDPPLFDAAGYLEAVAACRDRFPELRILSGAEVGEPHRHRDAVLRTLSVGPFDRVLGSLHCLYDDVRAEYAEPPGLFASQNPYAVVRRYLAEVVDLVATDVPFEVVAHVDYVVRYWPGAAGPFEPASFEDELRHALHAIADSGRALEVNTRVPLHPTVLGWWREEGGQAISFGSDAHDPASLARGFADASAVAEAHGFRPGRTTADLWPRAR